MKIRIINPVDQSKATMVTARSQGIGRKMALGVGAWTLFRGRSARRTMVGEGRRLGGCRRFKVFEDAEVVFRVFL